MPPSPPVAYDCVKLIFVRDGSAILFSELGEKPVKVGDVVALAANTLCGSDPEGSITVTTLYLDRDYIVDQVFWQHAALLADRLDAQDRHLIFTLSGALGLLLVMALFF